MMVWLLQFVVVLVGFGDVLRCWVGFAYSFVVTLMV